jgi:two-component system CheB/CheR fusion protein
MHQRNISVRERLTLGFGSIVVVLAALLSVTQWQQSRSAAAQERLTQRVLPRSTLALDLERSVLQVAIYVRAYLLDPLPAQRSALDRQLEETRRQLTVLSAMPKEADGGITFAQAEPNVLRYLRVADSIATLRPVFSADVERTLSSHRAAALQPLRGYGALQEAKRDESVHDMAVARDRVNSSVLIALLLGIGAALLSATLTTRSVERATQQLLRLATAFERGDWHTAVSWHDAALSSTTSSLRLPQGTTPRNEFVRLGFAFGAAGRAVEQRERELQAHTQVATASASSLDAGEISSQALVAMASHVHAAFGVVHLRGKGEQFEPVAQHAIDHAQPITIDDGLHWRAVAAGRTVALDNLPRNGPFPQSLGVDDPAIAAAVAVPLRVRDRTVGVATFGARTAFPDHAVRFLEATALQLSVGLENARTFADVQALLTQVSAQREQIAEQLEALQAQHEELQAQHEEIQAQGEEIQAQNEELQAQSEEIQAQNAQLQEQAGQLADADAQKNHFLGLLAHELRNPLAAVANCVYLLSTGADANDNTRRATAVIERQTRQLTRLIDDLLDITRIVRGKLHLERTPVDLAALLRDCVNDHRAMFDRQRLSVELTVPEEPLMVLGDRARLSQMVSNLLENAIKFTGTGGAVRLAAREDAGLLRVVIADNGVGIDPSLIPRLFQPFVQADPSRTRAVGGLGLGLSLVRAYAEMHGGTATAHSDGAGTGTTVELTLPAYTGGSPDLGARVHRADGKTNGGAVPRLRVLVIEDNVDAADSLQEALTLDGHDVQVARSAQQGLEIARDFRPSLILCDVGLPHMDGYELARRVRSEASLDGVRLVALTGYAMAEDRERARAAGFDRHLTKPATMQTLRALLASVASAGTTPSAREADATN